MSRSKTTSSWSTASNAKTRMMNGKNPKSAPVGQLLRVGRHAMFEEAPGPSACLAQQLRELVDLEPAHLIPGAASNVLAVGKVAQRR